MMFKKLLLSICGICISLVFLAQEKYSVTYTRPGSTVTLPFMGTKKFGSLVERLVFDDTLSFTYSYRVPDKDPGESLTIFGEKPIGKSTYYNAKQKVTYYHSKVDRGKKSLRGLYLISLPDSSRMIKWVDNGESKTIRGYNCLSLLNVDDNNDSTLVWYTPEIPLPFGPQGYTGFPGLVMEVQSQKLGYTIVLGKIEKKSFVVRMPVAKHVTREEMAEIWKKAYPAY